MISNREGEAPAEPRYSSGHRLGEKPPFPDHGTFRLYGPDSVDQP